MTQRKHLKGGTILISAYYELCRAEGPPWGHGTQASENIKGKTVSLKIKLIIKEEI